MVDQVFVGPSLSGAEVDALLPGATRLPPIRHGDLLRCDPMPGDRVFIVDGVFLGSAPVRHREILDVLRRGIVVAGSSGMGALRAAELSRYGMRGVGRVFELLRDGVITGDDEVAVLHGPAEDGYPLRGEPLVDTRIALAEAVQAGVLTAAEADALVELARALPFRVRGRQALARAARVTMPGDCIDRYLAWARMRRTDARAADARLLLAMAARHAPELAAPGTADGPIEHTETYQLERWRARHRGVSLNGRWVSDSDTVAVLMALHPDFPVLHRHHVLAELADLESGSPVLMRHRALELARAHGLLDAEVSVAGTGATPWLTMDEVVLPPAEAALRVLVRAFGTVVGAARSKRALPSPLLADEVIAVARRFVRAASAGADRLPRLEPHRTTHRPHFPPEAIDELFCELWRCTPAELTRHAWDRGFADLARLRTAMEPFVALLKVAGPPRFPTPPNVPASIGAYLGG